MNVLLAENNHDKSFARIAVAAFVCVFVVGSVAAQQAPGRWVTGTFAPLPEPGEEYTNAVLNGKLYLIGGNAVAPAPGQKAVHPSRVLEYDLATDTWARKKQMPFAADHMAAAGLGEKIYVFGGASAADGGRPTQLLDSTWEYTPATDSWRSLAPMPTRRTAAVAVESGGNIFVIGGTADVPAGFTLNTVDAYDPKTNTWESRRPMPTPRNHAAAGAVNGKIYVIGGRIAAPNIAGLVSSNTDVVEEYDPAADSWKVMNRMPTARSGHGWAAGDGRIYIAGGEFRSYDADIVFRSVEAFDPTANEWLRLPPMPTARHGVNLALFNHRLFAIGGHLAFAATGGHALDASTNEVFEFNE